MWVHVNHTNVPFYFCLFIKFPFHFAVFIEFPLNFTCFIEFPLIFLPILLTSLFVLLVLSTSLYDRTNLFQIGPIYIQVTYLFLASLQCFLLKVISYFICSSMCIGNKDVYLILFNICLSNSILIHRLIVVRKSRIRNSGKSLCYFSWNIQEKYWSVSTLTDIEQFESFSSFTSEYDKHNNKKLKVILNK